jgi:RimJ/RimL family protein N-acetyltransferase
LTPSDSEALYQAAADPLIWAQHPSPRYQRAVVVIDRKINQIIGTSRYYEWNESQKEVAVGFTFLARAYWGGPTNAELKKLMLDHAFRWVHTVWFHVAAKNTRSQKAMEKIGARLSHRAIKQFIGGPQEYLFFRIEASDSWRLAPESLEANGS